MEEGIKGGSPENDKVTSYAKPGERVHVKCGCGQVLTFVYEPGYENKSVICPVCKEKSSIRTLKRMTRKIDAQPGEIVKLKCGCGKVLPIRYQTGCENKWVICPHCNEKSPVRSLERVTSAPEPYAQPGEIVKLKCGCGKVLPIRYQTGCENKWVICPHCNEKSPVLSLERVPSASKPYAQPGEIVNLKCGCGTVLTFHYRQGAENQKIVCPSCGQKSQVGDLPKVRVVHKKSSSSSSPSTKS